VFCFGAAGIRWPALVLCGSALAGAQSVITVCYGVVTLALFVDGDLVQYWDFGRGLCLTMTYNVPY